MGMASQRTRALVLHAKADPEAIVGFCHTKLVHRAHPQNIFHLVGRFAVESQGCHRRHRALHPHRLHRDLYALHESTKVSIKG